MNIGDRFGKLIFLEDYKVELNGKLVSIGLGKFRCDCGNEYICKMSSVMKGYNKSCGCLLMEHSVEAMRRKNIKDGTNIGKIKSNALTKNNKTGIRGVNWNNGKQCWEASIGFKGVKYKKRFKNFEDAVKYRKEMEELLYIPFLDEIEKEKTVR